MDEALATLNSLLAKRYNRNSFTPLAMMSREELLMRILRERRKELVYRGIRWSDLRRLNLDASTAITLRRNLNGDIYELKPNSANYTFPIPEDAILLGGYEQNPRE